MAKENGTFLGRILNIFSGAAGGNMRRRPAVGGLYAGFEKLFAAFPFPAYARGGDGNILAANPPADDLLGISKPSSLLSIESMREDLFAEAKIFKSQKPAIYNFNFTDTKGNTRSARVIKTPVPDDAGKISAVITIFEEYQP